MGGALACALVAAASLLTVQAVRGRRHRWAVAVAVAALAAAVGCGAGEAALRSIDAERPDRLQLLLLAAASAVCGLLIGLAVEGARRPVRSTPLLQTAAGGAVLLLAVAGGSLVPPAAHAALRGSAAAAPSAARTTPVAATSTPAAPWRVQVVDRGPGYRAIDRWSVPTITAAQDVPLRQWRAAGAPRGGRLGSVVIPGTVSRFDARPALVYLPPAALTRTPARLPVVIAFSGQSKGAGPQDVQKSGGITAIMDAIAAAHGGVAPVVVVPDQLGPGSPNPMCVDSRLGRVATYVLHDVRDWILQHLPVETGRKQWTVAGFSEGGTCALQFAAGHPSLFGSFVDVSGELAPTNGTLAHTIAVGFHGSSAAYRAATPEHLLAAHAPYPPMRGCFAVGALDRHYGDVAPLLERKAAAAGIPSRLHVVPGLGHDWRVAAAGLTWGLTDLADWWGLPAGRT